MSDNRRLIKIENNLVWLSPNYHLKLDQTNFPPTVRFRDADPIYWEIALHNFRRIQQKICAQVIDYYPIHKDGFLHQKVKAELQKIEFEKLEWQFLEPFLSSYKKEELVSLIIDSGQIIVPDQTKYRFQFQTRIPLKEISYHLGYVSARVYHDKLGEEKEIRISNNSIIPEFQFIRSYFARKIKKKNIVVAIDVQMIGSRLKSMVAMSEDIASIDETFIDTIKYSRTVGLTKKPLVVAIDKSLFSADEVFDAFSDSDSQNVFNQSVQDIIKLLSEHGMVRNRKQLQYLSGRKQVDDFKIHITLNPVMGFLFLLEGEKMLHFCWELLNSHATYLWSFYKEQNKIEHAFKQIEGQIQMIRDHGRDRYKQAYRAGRVDDDLVFNLIVHRNAGSKVKDPFPYWRQQLEERLT